MGAKRTHTEEPRITLQGLRTLNTFMRDVQGELSGAEIARTSKLSSGTLYPILFRYEAAGWLTSRWEDVDPKKVGRPRQRLYRITPSGVARAQTCFNEFGGLIPA